jgi:hypothetical protein
MNLQNLGDKFAPLPAILGSTLKTVEGLQNLMKFYIRGHCPEEDFEKNANELRYHGVRLTEQLEGLKVLQQKVQGNLNLVYSSWCDSSRKDVMS